MSLVFNTAYKKNKDNTDYLYFTSDDSFSLYINRTSSVYDELSDSYTDYYYIHPNGKLEYSKDLKTWYDGGHGTHGTQVRVESGEKIYFRGLNNTAFFFNGHSKSTSGLFEATMLTSNNSGLIECHGNVETLLDYKKVKRGEHPAMGAYCFRNLFYNVRNLLTAPELPAETLSSHCYQSMFAYSELKYSPELPATTLAEYCYCGMFDGSKLVRAPELPATALANYCYYEMFHDCASLVHAPELPATALAEACYQSMFNGCTSLTIPPYLPSTIVPIRAYRRMFYGCLSLQCIPDISIINKIYSYGCEEMFCYCDYHLCTYTPIEGSSVEVYFNATLPSTGAALNIFTAKLPYMYDYTTNNISFTSSPKYFYTHAVLKSDGSIISSDDMPVSWFRIGSLHYDENTLMHVKFTRKITGSIAYSLYEGRDGRSIWSDTTSSFNNICSNADLKYYYPIYIYGLNTSQLSTSTTTSNIATLLVQDDEEQDIEFSCYGNIEALLDYNAVHNGEHPAMGNYCFYKLFYNSKIRHAPELPAETLSSHCYRSMFEGCSLLENVPALPAKTLKTYCYHSMFKGCTSLENVPSDLLTGVETLATYCYRSMFEGCSALEYPPVLNALTLASNCYYAMFKDCTSLIAVPILRATKLLESCYYQMFYNCASLAIANTQHEECTLEYKIPYETKAASKGTNWNYRMFYGTKYSSLSTTIVTPTAYKVYYVASIVDDDGSIIADLGTVDDQENS